METKQKKWNKLILSALLIAPFYTHAMQGDLSVNPFDKKIEQEHHRLYTAAQQQSVKANFTDLISNTLKQFQIVYNHSDYSQHSFMDKITQSDLFKLIEQPTISSSDTYSFGYFRLKTHVSMLFLSHNLEKLQQENQDELFYVLQNANKKILHDWSPTRG